jgi:hypothetical protein
MKIRRGYTRLFRIIQTLAYGQCDVCRTSFSERVVPAFFVGYFEVSVFLVRVAVGVCFLHLSSFKIFARRPDWLNPNGGRVVVCVVNAPNCRLPNTAMRRAVRLGVRRNAISVSIQ